MLEIDTIVLLKDDFKIGEIIAKDNDFHVVKILRDLDNNKVTNSYKGYLEKDLIDGKKKSIDYLNEKIDELIIKKKNLNNELLEFENANHSKISIYTSKIRDYSMEIDNILKNQEINKTVSREKQIKCLHKAIKRANKKANILYTKKKPNFLLFIKNIDEKIKKYQSFICILKSI